MRNKKNLQSQSSKIYLKDEETPLRKKILFSLRRDPTIKSAPSVNEKISVYNANDKIQC